MNTRSATRKREIETQEKLNENKDNEESAKAEKSQSIKSISRHSRQTSKKVPSSPPFMSSQTHSKSSSSHKKSEIKRLQLQAARERAQIRLELIDMELEANIAEVFAENESQITGKSDFNVNVEQWLESSHQEMTQQAPDNGHLTGTLSPLATVTEHAHTTADPAPELAPEPALPSPAAPPLAAPVDCTDGSTVHMLASALRDLTATANMNVAPNARLLSRLCTPKDLPDFSGDPMEWLQFKQAYEESTQVCNFSDKENLWRLRKCLRGSAKDAVSALLISATSPQKIMSTLELLFGNPECIISTILMNIKKLPPLSNDYQKEIVPFAVKIQNYVEAVRAVGCEEYLQGINIVSIVLSRLPAILVSKWSDYSYPLITNCKESRLVLLADFLRDEAQKVVTTANIYFSSGNGYQRINKTHDNSTRTVLVQAEGRDNISEACQFCHAKSNHKLTECKHFKRALNKVRWQHVKRNRLCYKCLLSQHDRATCPAPVCDKDNCGQAHHRLLHYRPRDDRSSGALPPPPPPPPPPSLPPPSLPLLPPPSISTNLPTSRDVSTPIQTVTHINAGECKVLLKVVPIRVHGPNGTFDTSALLDDGSSVTMVSAQLANRVGLQGYREKMHVRGAWNDNELVCDTVVTSIKLSGMDNKVHIIRARSVKEMNLPKQCLSTINFDQFVYLSDIKNCLCISDRTPEILIGQDNYDLLLPLEIRLGKPNEPSATLTPLGWCIHGRVNKPRACSDVTLFLSVDSRDSDAHAGSASAHEKRLLQDIHDDVHRYFTFESMGIEGKPRQNSDELRAVKQLEQTAQLQDGRWVVGLPWKDQRCNMPDSYPNALKRLKSIERKLEKDEGYAERYIERVKHLLDNNYAKELNNTEVTSKTWYLPHFGVDNPNKKKLRLTFDAAARVEGKCLNDYLLTGPDLLSSLFGIMLRFRENKIAVTGDIKDMFLRVKIRPEDQHAFRFLWRDKPIEPIKTYVMTSLIFGANCSPFIAQFIKNMNAQYYLSSKTESMATEVQVSGEKPALRSAAEAICDSHYMDDYIQSLPDETTAIEMVKNLTKIHSHGGFEICKWTSNSLTVLDSVPKESLGTAAVRFKFEQQHEGERTLGLIWYPAEDKLGFDVSLKRIPENIIQGKQRPTKRLMLRVIMSIFDVLGFLSPFTIQGKIMLQDTWRLNIDWDDYITEDLYTKWCKWLDLLQEISQLHIPRWYNTAAGTSEIERGPVKQVPTTDFPSPSCSRMSATQPSGNGYDLPTTATNGATNMTISAQDYRNLQLHVFSDASTKAMCAVAYWRWNDNSNIKVSFIASKCRVVPVKPITVPRSELQAALLAARLAGAILKQHNMPVQLRYFWCDSTTVLHWIRNNKRTYKTFEANRLGEIDELTRIPEWRYVPTELNVADLATRESFDLTLFQGKWFHGPKFLYQHETQWPTDVIGNDMNMSIECVAVTEEVTADLPVPDPRRFSSWLRLLRATATVLNFINKCKGLNTVLDCSTMEQAECLLLKSSQADTFANEISAIKKGKPISRNSKLLTLSPVLDERGLLCVDGRINAAVNIDLEKKRPVILEGQHAVARLLVMQYHVRAAHGNQETVVNNLKQKYWIIKLRPTVKSVVSRCMLCRIRKSKPQIPRMGDLPQARVAHHQRPFTFCGLDLFGPMEVTIGRRREKRYGVLFTCMTVRAVHVELVSSLTTDALIMALRRMAARRGWPSHLYSDNGTNMRGSDKELQRSIKELNHENLQSEGTNNGMEWHFIPPLSPNWGGAWERLIRSVKTSLKIVLNDRAPREEVLCTLLAEVENMVNSRPLGHVSVEAGSIETLTPNHFLLGSSSNIPVIGVFDDTDMHLRKQWRKSQLLADMYWRRWVKEILPDLLPRKKWNSEQKPLQIGDLVMVVDPDSPRNVWPKGLITQIYPGKDGRIRLVDVKTKTGTWRRSAARVAPISLDD